VFCTSSAAGRARVLALNTTCRGRGVGVAIREGDFHLLRSAGGFAFPPVVPLQLPISWPRCRRSENRISLQHSLHRSLPGREESWALTASTHVMVAAAGSRSGIDVRCRRYLRLCGQIHGQDRCVLGLVVAPAGIMVHSTVFLHYCLACCEQVHWQGFCGPFVVVARAKKALRWTTRRGTRELEAEWYQAMRNDF
jgi:hypothetical protein